MVLRNNKGFSLIELMIVIAIIGILVAVALPQFAAMTEDAKKTKAKQDCDTFVQSIQKFNSLEGTTVQDKFMVELKGKYITNYDTMKDPWGNRYEQDYKKGNVYSKGPDGKHDDAKKATEGVNKDDIVVPYIGALTIIDAKLEVNPAGGNYQDTAESAKCYDVLHLYFNKEVTWNTALVMDSVNTAAKNNQSTTDDGASAGNPCTHVFRYYNSAKADAIPLSPTATDSEISDLAGATNAANTSNTASGAVYYGADSKEVVIKFVDGKTSANTGKKLLIPGTHYINLVGAKNTKNPAFFEVGGVPKDNGAESAGAPVQIKNFD